MLFFNEFADKWQCELSTKCCSNSKPIFGIRIHPESQLRASIPRLIRSATVTPQQIAFTIFFLYYLVSIMKLLLILSSSPLSKQVIALHSFLVGKERRGVKHITRLLSQTIVFHQLIIIAHLQNDSPYALQLLKIIRTPENESFDDL